MPVWADAKPATAATAVAAKVEPVPVVEPKIVGPDTAAPGTLVIFEAAVPSESRLAWKIYPPSAKDNFRIDTGGGMAYFASPVQGKFLVILAVATGDNVFALTHELVQGNDPNPPNPPDPDPGPDPPPPDQKYTIVFFIESDDLDNYSRNKDWNIMLASTLLRDQLKDKGHTFLNEIDYNSIEVNAAGANCTEGICTLSPADLRPWYTAAKMYVEKGGKTPFVALSPVEGGKEIKVYPMPETLAKFNELIGEPND